MQRSNIEWTTFTANPIVYERKSDGRRVWACVKKSPGCKHCYAEALAKRYGRGAEFNEHEMSNLTVLVDEKQIRRIVTAKTIGGVPVDGSMVFIGDMTDVFGDWVPFELLDVVFAAFALRPSLIGQFLTKRPDRAREYFATPGRAGLVAYALGKMTDVHDPDFSKINAALKRLESWPLSNVWLGTSCERQAEADERIPELLRTPAAVRFISAEPLLEPLNVCPWIHADWSSSLNWWKFASDPNPAIDWVIVGGESGPGARPLRPHWIRNIIGPCRTAKTPVFIKQLGSHVIDRNDAGFEGDTPGGWPMDTENACLTGQGWQGDPVRVRLRDRKGGDMSEWPADLRVRELPEVRA